jgi:hypothetical protein
MISLLFEFDKILSGGYAAMGSNLVMVVCVGCGCVVVIRWVCNDSKRQPKLSMLGCHFQACVRDATFSCTLYVRIVLLSSLSFENPSGKSSHSRQSHLIYLFRKISDVTTITTAIANLCEPETGSTQRLDIRHAILHFAPCRMTTELY